MPLKFINAHDLRPGTFAIIDGAPCVIKNIDISKTGKHGASKCRVEAVGIIDDKKRITVMPGSEKVTVPLIEKKRAQLLSLSENTASVMDTETYETLELPISPELVQEINERKDKVEHVEYWDIEGKKIIKRIL